jgi:hypothetical protein
MALHYPYSSVSYASSATQPRNVLSFVIVVTSPLPILLLVQFLPLATWFPDTGANQHVTHNLATLTDSAPYLG